jgi:hypothetical protein
MENTPLKINRMPYFNRYQAMGRQVSTVTQTLQHLIMIYVSQPFLTQSYCRTSKSLKD